MSATQARKVLRRTLTGGTLVLAVAGLLFWTRSSAHGEPILYAAAILLYGAIVEASRMGSLATRDLFPALLMPAAGAILLLVTAVQGSVRTSSSLLLVVLWCGALAACTYSLGRVLTRPGAVARGVSRLVVYLVVGFVVIMATEDPRAGLRTSFFVLGALLALSLLVLARQANGMRSLWIAVGLAVWIVPPIPAIWQIWKEWSTGGLVAFLLCAKIGDTAGYYVGTAFGRHHPFPRISPGKTLEGCVGSFLAGTAAGGVAVSTGLLPGGIAGGLAAGALVNLAAQAGDLLESWVKRRAGVKDSSGVFGPSGGLLDQLDSVLLAVPTAIVAWPWCLA